MTVAILEAQKGLQKIEDDALSFIGRLESISGGSTNQSSEVEALRARLEAKALQFEDRLRSLEKLDKGKTNKIVAAEQNTELSEGGAAWLQQAQKDSAEIDGMAQNLQERIAQLEQLEQVVAGGALQDAAQELQVRVGSLEDITVPQPDNSAADEALKEVSRHRAALEQKAAELSERVARVEMQRVGMQQPAPAALSTSVTETSKELQSFEEAFNSSLEKLQSLQSQMDATEMEKSNLRAELDATEMEKSNLRAELALAKEKASVKSAGETEKLQSLQSQIDATEAENLNLRAELAREKQMASVSTVGETEKIESLQSQIDASEAEKAYLRAELAQATASNVGEIETLQSLQSQIDASDREKSKLRAELDKAKTYAEQMASVSESEKTALQAELEQSAVEKYALRADLEQSKTNALDTIRELEGVIESKNAQLVQSQQDEQIAIRQLNEMSAELAKAREQAELAAENSQTPVNSAAARGHDAVVSALIQGSAEQDQENSQRAAESLRSQLAACSQEKVNIRIEYQKSLKEATDRILQLEETIAAKEIAPAPVQEVTIATLEDSEVPELRQQVEVLTLDNVQYQEKLEEAKAVVEARVSEKSQLERLLRDAELRIENQERNAALLSRDLAVKEEQILKLSEQIKGQAGPSRLSGGGQRSPIRSSPSNTAISVKARGGANMRDSASPISASGSSSPGSGAARATTYAHTQPPKRSIVAPVQTSSRASLDRPTYVSSVRPGRTQPLIQSSFVASRR